ncbi:hypothetical protein WBG78_28275 [Chryseolinea sp. T2]|uniref:hypothetical protein n=1 Tax=Chryseolinea sp. T2 TaxID=3129255 RepID=UPI0030769370
MKRLIVLSLALLVTSSCWDRRNIVVKGLVTDEENGQPIPNAEVVVLCWYMHGIDEASFVKQSVKTDKFGSYYVEFDKGHEIEAAARITGFNPARSNRELDSRHVQIDLKLARINENPSLVSHLTIDGLPGDDDYPFLRIRIENSRNGNGWDMFGFETLGFDLMTQRANSDTLNCDLWFKPVHELVQPKVIVAHRGGGIIPVFTKDINSSFLFERPIAPADGYLHEYTLTGTEEGLFVLCRDGKTFGKIIFEKVEIDQGWGAEMDESVYYRDIGKSFSFLYQPNGTRDLSFSRSDIDLEDFLVDGRLR